MKIFSFLLLVLVWSTSAKADSSFSCGKDKNKADRAEIFFAESLEGANVLRVKGENFSAKDFHVKPTEGRWIITVYGESSVAKRKFVFYVAEKEVEEFQLLANGEQKVVGSKKACVVSSSED